MTFEMNLPAMKRFAVNSCPRCGGKPKVLANLDSLETVSQTLYTTTRVAVCEKCGISADLDTWDGLSWRDDNDQS